MSNILKYKLAESEISTYIANVYLKEYIPSQTAILLLVHSIYIYYAIYYIMYLMYLCSCYVYEIKYNFTRGSLLMDQ